ncbi:MAG TPA: flagellar export chaperone FliS [Solirubrobacterales bacterium]|jgi:flagellar protein FliS
MNPYRSASQAYAQDSVLTAAPEKLVVMLYDGLARFLARGAAALRAEDIATAGNALNRAGAILDELLATLDPAAGEVAQRLADIYLFCKRELLAARLKRDPKRIERVAKLLAELRDAWATIAEAPPATMVGRPTLGAGAQA